MLIAKKFSNDIESFLPANIPYNQALYLIKQNPAIFQVLYRIRRKKVKIAYENLKKQTKYPGLELLSFEENIGQLSYILAKKHEFLEFGNSVTIAQTDIMRDALEEEVNIYPDHAFTMMLALAGTIDPESIEFLKNCNFYSTDINILYNSLIKSKGNAHTYK